MSVSAPAPAGLANPRATPRRVSAGFALLGVVQATLIFTITAISVPLPVIGRELGLSPADLVLVTVAYGVPFSALLLFGGRLTDRYGGRLLFTVGLALFAAASGAAAVAWTFELLVAARFAQGVGAALVAPAAVAVLQALFPDPRRYGRAMATWGGLSVLGATTGILLAGLVTTWLSWRWMFAVPLLVGAVALAVAPRWLPVAAPTPRAVPNGPATSDAPATSNGLAASSDPAAPTPPPAPTKRAALDLPGAALATAGVSLLSYGLVTVDGSGLARALVPVAAGVALLAGFAVVELRGRDPLLPLAFLANRRRLAGLLAIALGAAGSATVFLLLTLYLQQVLGWTPARTSLAFVPYALVLIAAGRLARTLLARLDARFVAGAGLAVTAGGLALLTGLAPDTTYAGGLLPGLMLLPAGMGLTFAGAAVLVAADAPAHQAGLAGGVLNTAIELGPTIGLALLTTAGTARTAQLAAAGASPLTATTGGYAWALGAAALAFAVLALLTPLVPPQIHRHPKETHS